MTLEERLELARNAVRLVERFAYRIVSDAEGLNEVHAARDILRLTVGLRRKLDNWHGKDHADSHRYTEEWRVQEVKERGK